MKSTSPASKLLARFSRRSFFGSAAAAGGAVLLGSSIPSKVWADDDDGPSALCNLPVPIPHINTPPPGGGHFYFPGSVHGTAAATDPSGAHPEGRDPSPIFNFKGFIGSADLTLTGTGTDLKTGDSKPYMFHTDMRFMHGMFIGTDLVPRKATFAFI